MNRPTLKDVAARAGVSISTVSYALNAHSTVPLAESTKLKIRRIAQELGYVPNGVARQLQSRSSRTIGVLLNKSIANPRYAAITQGLSQGLSQNGYHAALLAELTAVHCIDEVRGGRLDGLVFIGSDDHEVPPELAAAVGAYSIPFVALDSGAVGNESFSSVDFDYRAGVDDMITHLVTRGIRSVYFVRPDVGSRAERARESAILAALSSRPEITLQMVPTGLTTAYLDELEAGIIHQTSYVIGLMSSVEVALRADRVEPERTALVCSWGADAEYVYAASQRVDSRFVVGALASGSLDVRAWPNLAYSRLPLHEAGMACARLILEETTGNSANRILLAPVLDAGLTPALTQKNTENDDSHEHHFHHVG